MNLASKFEMIDKSLDLGGFTKETKNDVYKILAVILNLGNIDIKESNGCMSVSEQSKKFIDSVAALANLTTFDLEQSLFNRTIKDAGMNGTEIR